MPSKPVVGLIGGMGSGKSLVAGLLAQRGAKLISGDELGHEALRQADVKARLVERWGPGILARNGEVERRRVAKIVFDDPQERKALERVVFPWIEERIREQIAEANSDPRVALVVLDAAIMLETGWNKVCTWLVYIDAPREERLRRLAQQRGWSLQDVEARERAQLPLAEKWSCAEFRIDNSGSPDEVVREVDELLRRWGIAK
jgi:dephospho-CoA kinase